MNNVNKLEVENYERLYEFYWLKIYFRYGLCRSVDEIKPCESGEDAEEILLEPRDFDGQIYTRVGLIIKHKNLARTPEYR